MELGIRRVVSFGEEGCGVMAGGGGVCVSHAILSPGVTVFSLCDNSLSGMFMYCPLFPIHTRKLI